ncbi:pyrroloquinoline quinone-dependent dehydrogenase [Deinococcus pimensis]|uniref:pyrroloquinoline quinone-dependent dehydrogenase n=1 Tax=Deinococcus pimensis TaxID=309888 RepID=UPI0004B57C1F|nr:PQQ-binding-like beta-propeller repeat protein [Deinococcus pimensis]
MQHLTKLFALSLSLLSLAAAQGMGPTQGELNAADTDTNSWLMMNKGYSGQRYVALSQINTRNVGGLQRLCTFDTKDIGSFQATPQVYQGVMYVMKGYRTYAINARNCNLIWQHEYKPTGQTVLETSRGAALYNGMLIRGTGDAHLFALNMRTGKLMWDTKVADSAYGYFTSSAPIVWNGMVYMGEAGADWGIKARMHAFDASTGKLRWTFDMVPTGQQYGANTWQRAASTTTGGGSMWTSYTLNPRNGRLYISVGNPAPDFAAQYRPGANLFTNSVVVLNARTGRLDHYYQQRPNDDKDLDTSPAPTLYAVNGVPHMAVANKEGNIYTYNEATLKPVYKVATVKQVNMDTPPTPEGVRICPNYSAGSQWYGTTYHPMMNALVLPSTDWCGTVKLGEVRYVQAQLFFGGNMQLDPENTAIGQVSAFDAATGRRLWRYQVPGTRVIAGVTNTAGNLVMSGDLKGRFFILDARNGRQLFRYNIDGAPIGGGASTYLSGGKQYIAVAAGNTSRAGTGPKPTTARIVIFGLR